MIEKLKFLVAIPACAVLLSACGGGSGTTVEDTTASADSTTASAQSTTSTSGTAATQTATAASTTGSATTTAADTPVTTTTTTTTSTQAAGTATKLSAAAGSVTLSWATPAANATVKGTTAFVLTGQAFKNVEIFSGGVKIATAAVSGDSTSATASIDTTQFANGALALTAHAWNSAAGATFTSDADAGTLNLVVSNAATVTTAAATATTTTATTTAATTTTTTATTTTGTQIGINLHQGGTNTTDNQTIANILGARHLTSARMELNKDLDLTLFRDQMTRLKAAGVQPEINLQTSYQWDYSCNQNFTAVESDAYNQTVVLVQRVYDLATDFELLNEVSLRPDATSQVTQSQAAPVSAYAGSSCYSTLASVLRGMSRAIHDQASASGKPLRVILGAVGNDFPFLDYMQSQGVSFDVVGYHIYPSLQAPAVATDPFYGAGGPVGMLAKYSKPVRINEFNCGEIYNANYDNLVGSASTLACMASIQKHLASLMKQTVVKLETVDAFVLLDDPSQSNAAEKRFGLMYDLNTPKIHLSAYSLFAGGAVSALEKAALAVAGLLGD